MSDKGSILLKVDNNVTYITGQLDSVVYKKLKKKLGYIPEDVYWMIETNKKKGKNKDGSYKRGQEWRKDWDGSISTVCWNKAKGQITEIMGFKDPSQITGSDMAKKINLFNVVFSNYPGIEALLKED